VIGVKWGKVVFPLVPDPSGALSCVAVKIAQNLRPGVVLPPENFYEFKRSLRRKTYDTPDRVGRSG
jgi:hypothetical protein